MEPDVAHGQGESFEQMENGLQFHVGERLACDAAVEESDSDQSFTIHDRDSDLRAENMKFPLYVRIGEGGGIIAPEDASELEEVSADAAFIGKIDVINQFVLQTDRRGRAKAAGFCGS